MSVPPVFALISLLFLASGCTSHSNPAESSPQVALVRVVSVGDDPGHINQGRGFIVSPDGMIVTRLHLLNPQGQILVTPIGGVERPAKLVQEDKDADLAIIQILGEKWPFLHLYDEDVEPGIHLRVYGSEGISHGVFDHWENVGRDMAITARVGLGDAGAPLLGDDGRVVGVVNGVTAGSTAGNLATPTWHVLKMMPQLAHPAPIEK